MAKKTAAPGRTPLPVGIAAPARRALAQAGVETLEQVVELGLRRLSTMHGMCARTLAQLQDAMDEHGLVLPAG